MEIYSLVAHYLLLTAHFPFGRCVFTGLPVRILVFILALGWTFCRSFGKGPDLPLPSAWSAIGSAFLTCLELLP